MERQQDGMGLYCVRRPDQFNGGELLIAAKGSEFGVRSEAWEHEEPPRRQIGAKSGACAPSAISVKVGRNGVW